MTQVCAKSMVYGKIGVEVSTLFMPFEKICTFCNKSYSVAKKKDFETSKYCSKRCWYDARANLVLVGEEKHKRCNKCSEVKPFSEYHTCSANKVIGIKSTCKTCVADVQREYMKTNYEKRYRASRQWRANNLERARERDRGYTQKLKKEVLDALGGECACCGENHIAFLNVDHINEDGAEHRRQLYNGNRTGGTSVFYRDVRKQGYPKDKFQVLCFNCNIAKHHYGICPHQETGI